MWDTHLIRGKQAIVCQSQQYLYPPHMKSISSIFGVLLCKKMSVYHWLRIVQLGTHQHKERTYFSLVCLNFPSWSMWLPESKLITDIELWAWGTSKRTMTCFYEQHIFSPLYDRDCASFPWEIHWKLIVKINWKMCTAFAWCSIKSEMWPCTSQPCVFIHCTIK